MANIRVDINNRIKNGSEAIFIAPCDCSAIDGMNVYHLDADGNEIITPFIFKDAHGNNLAEIDNAFAEGVYVKVILNVTDGIAYIQNADTNKYLEDKFGDIESILDIINGEVL